MRSPPFFGGFWRVARHKSPKNAWFWALPPFLVLASCTQGVRDLPPPPTTGSTTSTSGAADLSLIDLEPAAGSSTTTAVVMGPGLATIKGDVMGPDGPVEGAVVQVERVVGSGIAGTRLATPSDGTWKVEGVLGGSYRVRAWRAPDLSLTTPLLVFIEAREIRQMSVPVVRQSGLKVSASIAPAPPVVSETSRLVVQVVHRTVDDEGVVHSSPVAGARLELFGSGSWTVETDNPIVSDDDGEGTWDVTCGQSGRQPLSVVVAGEDAMRLELPDCAATRAAPETSSTTDKTTTTRRGGTPTTRRELTTSTTRRSAAAR